MKKKYLIAIGFLIFWFGIMPKTMAQEVEKATSPFSLSLDMMSRYVWRGTDFGASPSMQPGISYSHKGFTVGAWGAYAMNLTGAQEADLYVSYSPVEMFTVTLTDYFFPDEVNDYDYFNYDKNSTGHILEASVSFNGTEKLPMTVLLATNVYGADAARLNAGGEQTGIQYSSYAELKYSFKNIDLFIGANLTDPNEDHGESGFYGDKMGVVNLGISTSKEIKITNSYSLPLNISLITNPQAKRIFLVAGFSF